MAALSYASNAPGFVERQYVFDTEEGDVYIRRTARDYQIPQLARHDTHRN